MEMNPVPVLAAERDLLQIITAITVAAAVSAETLPLLHSGSKNRFFF